MISSGSIAGETGANAANGLGVAGAAWLPIESAPKDGTWVLVFGNVWAGEISGVARNPKGDVGIARYTNGKSDYPGDWWDEAGDDAYSCWCQPTHWMPLPPAPTPQEARHD